MESLSLFMISTIGYLSYASFIQRHRKQLQTYIGRCHCRAIQFVIEAPTHLVVWDCNCSICTMKKNWHFMVPESRFRLLSGQESMSTYQFNTKVAKHIFCQVCGVQAFYRPRSNPDGYAITFACIESLENCTYEIRKFEGDSWEDFIEESGIQRYSKIEQ